MYSFLCVFVVLYVECIFFLGELQTHAGQFSFLLGEDNLSGLPAGFVGCITAGPITNTPLISAQVMEDVLNGYCPD